MSKYVINDTTLTGIGDAIRAKGGTTALIPVTGLADAITNLPTGGGEIEFPAVVNMKMSQINYQGAYDWLWDIAPAMTILHSGGSDIGFNASTLEDLSHLTIKLGYNASGTSASNFFRECSSLKTLPNVIFLGNVFSNISGFLQNSPMVREIPSDIFMAKDDNGESLGVLCFSSPTACRTGSVFNGCKSLRYHAKLHDGTQRNGNSGNAYNNLFYNCHALNEITDLPVYIGAFTSNQFSSTFNKCSRVQNIKFAMVNDSTPYTADWKNQTIDLTDYVGYALYENDITGYNSGITTDKRISSVDEYAKMGPADMQNWYSLSPSFCRYDLVSAQLTIKTLPDTSAYITTNGGTNTIKFSGECGIKDKWIGASNSIESFIKNMPDSSVAAAAAKGWTVTLI